MESMNNNLSIGNNKDNNSRETRQCVSQGYDYISHLPEELLCSILYFLPFKYWIMMSLVSKRWKDLWTQISILNLDEREITRNINRKEAQCAICGEFRRRSNPNQCFQHSVHEARRKFSARVDRILLFHSGCIIHKFCLSFRYDTIDRYSSRIGTWLHFVMTRNIEHLELNFFQGMPIHHYTREDLIVRRNNLAQPYTLPHRGFVPKLLKILTLNFCKFEVSSFGALPSLQQLSLVHADILDNSIADLVSKCPILEDLRLKFCFISNEFLVCKQAINIKSLTLINCMTENRAVFPIDMTAPNLVTLQIMGTYLVRSYIRKAKTLIDVKIDIGRWFADHEQGNFLASLLTDFCSCQTLALSTWCLQVLPTGNNLVYQLQVPLNNLKHLRLKVGLVKQELPGIACLLRSCPKLENLIFDMDLSANIEWIGDQDMIPNIFEFQAQNYWESQNFSCCSLKNSLKEIKIYGFSGRKAEMRMAKFLLQYAAVLERFDIYYYGLNTATTPTEQNDCLCKQMTNLSRILSYPKAAAHAVVNMLIVQHSFPRLVA